ncbi:unnamed protein product, partial [marine sediment metagenome]
PYLDGKTDSELKSLLLTLTERFKRPPVYNIDRIDILTREELIDAIKEQQRVPTKSSYMEDTIVDELLELGEVPFQELVDGSGVPVRSLDSQSVWEAVQETPNMVQTPDGLLRFYYDFEEGVTVVSEEDNIEEYFSPDEFDEAVNLLQTLLSRRSFSATGAEIPPEFLEQKPAVKEVTWAKSVIAEGKDLLKTLDDATDEAIKSVERELSINRGAINAD